MITEELRYVVLADKDPRLLAEAVTALLNTGWQLHGELRLQTVADESALTFARLVYVQAMWRPKDA